MWLPLSLLLVILFFVIKNKIINAEKHSPPGPPGLPIIGNLHQLGSLPHRSLAQLSRRYGHVMFLKFGSIPTMVISSAEAAKEVLKIHDVECCNRPHLAGPRKLSYDYKDVGFSPYGEHSREMRKICVLNLFSTKRVDSFRVIRTEEVASLVDSLSSVSTNVVDVSEMLVALTTKIAFRIAFGTGLDVDGFHKIVHRAHVVLGSFAASDFFPSVGWIVDRITGLHAKFDRSFHELDNFFQQKIKEHLERGPPPQDREDIVDAMLRIERDQYEFGEFRFTRDCFKAILMNIFLAGVDTAATTMIWAMAELARNPRVMKKAQDEIRSRRAKNNKFVTESEIDELHYLHMIVKETLRLYPPAPLLIPREIISQFNLAGYEVRPKTVIQINAWALGRDPKYWDNPEEFFPERFADSPVDFKGHHFEFLPFGAGRRGCPGIYMAMSTIELALANILCCFDWKLPDGETDIDMEEAFGITSYKKSALRLVPISYQWPSED